MVTTNGSPRTSDVEASAEAGRWTLLQEAAAALGISRDAVRRRVAARVLRAERRRTARGPRLFVWLPAEGLPDLVELPETVDAEDDAAPRGGTDAAHSGADSARGGADAARGGAERRNDAPSGATLAAARAEEMARYTAVLLEPWHRQAEAQAERIGRLENEVEHLRAQLAEAAPTEAQAEAQDAPQAEHWPEARTWWQKLLWG